MNNDTLMNDFVQKAGGIIRRLTTDGRIEVYCVHRSQYNDWSFPKGHIDENESAEDAALREVREETGLECRILRAFPSTIYTSPDGTRSHVRFFEMEILRDGHPTDGEVDAGQWVALDALATILSYPSMAATIQKWYSEVHK